MDGQHGQANKRWGWWGLLCLIALGCHRQQVHTPLEATQQTAAWRNATGSSHWRSFWSTSSPPTIQRPVVDHSPPSLGPLRPETIAALAQVQLDAAFHEQTVPASREQLLDHAREGFHKALQLDPKNGPALLGLARYHARLGERDKALQVYQRYLQYYPQDKQVRHELAFVHAQWKDWDGAVDWCDQALQLDPENRTIRKTKGFCLARAGRYDEALAVFREIMPESLARYHLARVLEHQGQAAASRQQLLAALQADPQCEQARAFLEELEAAYFHRTPKATDLQPAGHQQAEPQSAVPQSREPATPPLTPLGGIPLPSATR
jgi:Tfp pilus assembly protein PilF